jgi:23S rRNA-/tRNA-specific pseudouridylate synthase
MSTMNPTILYKDEDLLVLNKPSLWVSESHEQENRNIEHWAQQNWDERARVLHRLDRATSGVIAVSLRRKHHSDFVKLWENRQIEKVYQAWVEGQWDSTLKVLEGRDNADRSMKTHVKVLRIEKETTLLELKPITGRRYQLRLQCADQGHPILGDLRHGASQLTCLEGMIALHACSLRFLHPVLKKEIFVEAPLPDSWAQWTP